jgi:hypothetical protein
MRKDVSANDTSLKHAVTTCAVLVDNKMSSQSMSTSTNAIYKRAIVR